MNESLSRELKLTGISPELSDLMSAPYHLDHPGQWRSFELVGERSARGAWTIDSDQTYLGLFWPESLPHESLDEMTRGQLAGEIHDGCLQYAVGAKMWLESLRELVAVHDAEQRDEMNQNLASIEECLQGAIDASRRTMERLLP